MRLVEGLAHGGYQEHTPVYAAVLENRSDEDIEIQSISFDYSASEYINIERDTFHIQHYTKPSIQATVIGDSYPMMCGMVDGSINPSTWTNTQVSFDVSQTIKASEVLEICVYGSIKKGTVIGGEIGEYVLMLDDMSLVEKDTGDGITPYIFENYSVIEIQKWNYSIIDSRFGNNDISLGRDDFQLNFSTKNEIGRFIVKNESDEKINLQSFDLKIFDQYERMPLGEEKDEIVIIISEENAGAFEYENIIHADTIMHRIDFDIVLEPGEEKEIRVELGLRGNYDDWVGKKIRFRMSNITGETINGDIRKGVGNHQEYHYLSYIDVE